jgi:beta-galactosidase/beta-glucuronidase
MVWVIFNILTPLQNRQNSIVPFGHKMKFYRVCLHAVSIVFFWATAHAASVINFDFDWKFHLGDSPEAAGPGFADDSWRHLNVPHDFSIESDFARSNVSSTAFLPGGIAWYRKTFTIPSDWVAHRVSIEFDGVSRSSQVWLNGHLLGEHGYGYTPFNFDLTPYIKFTDSNVLAVRVDRSRIDDSRWYPGSGIIRHVWLRAYDPLHVARHGVYVTTPEASAASAEVKVQTKVQNESNEAIVVQLVTQIIAPDGALSTLPAARKTIAAGGEETFDQSDTIANPNLWSPKHPSLCRIRSTVRSENEQRDTEETTFGIRSIRFDAATGFYLNGDLLKLHGVCVHQDAGGLGGAAMLDCVWERRLRILQGMGVNAIRCSHNPAPAFFYDLCDRLGLLVIDEAFDEWNGPKRKWVEGWNVGKPSHGAGYSEYFDKWSESDLREMVLRSRNHPSVILWSIGNEIDYPNDPFSYPTEGEHYDSQRPSAEILARSGARLASIVRRLDPTRPVTAGLANLKTSNATGLADQLDVVGYNYQFDQYSPDMGKYPGRKFVGSENGYGPNYFNLTQENPRVSGQFLWVGIDYLGESKRWPLRGWDDGLLDTCAFKKPRAAYRQALWSDNPMVYVCVHSAGVGSSTKSWQGEFGWEPLEAHWNWKDDPRAQLPVIVYSNCREVELFLNGRSLGVHQTDADRTSRWAVTYEPGELKAIGTTANGETTEDTLITAGKPVRMELLPDVKSLSPNREDAVEVEIRTLDDKGNFVPTADPLVSVEVTGVGSLAGLDNGDQGDTTRLTSPSRKLHHGRALAVVRSSRQSGTITITVHSATLPPAQLSVACEHHPR